MRFASARHKARIFFVCMVLAGLSSACSGPMITPDAGHDAGPELCTGDDECADGLFCNGVERCAPGDESADARGCVAARAPACAEQRCDEDANACVACDADGDGHDAIECAGDDCDDADADRYPGNAEVCDDADHDEDCDASTFGYRNGDGDAFVDASCCNVDGAGARICGDDCNDAIASINPESTEACDGVDNDCDGVADDGLSGAWFPDCDGDHFGATADPVTTCAPPIDPPAVCAGAASARWADVDGDCDDTNASRQPAASEECNAIDDDCDGMLDGAGEDVDEDGFASAACGGTDCDDTRAEVHPGASELCDGLDDDCNGVREDADGDLHLATAEACSGGALDALPRDDCDDADPAVRPGATDVCNGVDDDCNGTVDDTVSANASCSAPDGSAECVLGACAATSCPAQHDDCDGDYRNGCEADLASDRDHCGTCSIACGLVCDAGACDDPVQISAHAAHTCARLASGRVVCWGEGDSGQLGHGAFADAPRPVFVSGLNDAIDVDAGSSHSCAVRMGGQAQCWGDASWGQLGEGDFVFTPRSTPVDVVRGSGMAAIAAGDTFSCAVRSDRTMACWGNNNDGELGRTYDVYGVVADVAGVTDAIETAAGFNGTCALLSSGHVSCWGGSNYLGDGGATRFAPADVTGLSDAVAIDLSMRYFACALRSGGGGRCWGEGYSGQLGNGTTTGSRTPVDVSGLTGAIAIGTGDDHACAVTSSGSVLCWGNDDTGELGDGMRTRRLTPITVPGIADATDVACGNGHTCVLRASGQIWCWGANMSGQLGDGTTMERLSPVRVEAP